MIKEGDIITIETFGGTTLAVVREVYDDGDLRANMINLKGGCSTMVKRRDIVKNHGKLI